MSSSSGSHAAITLTGSNNPPYTGSDPWDIEATTRYGYISVGNNNTGTLRVDGGSSVITESGYIGGGEGVSGTATITGAGSTWDNSAGIQVGMNGPGVLNVTNGGLVNTGTLLVSRDGSGEVNIENAIVRVASNTTSGLGPYAALKFNNGTLETGSLQAGVSELNGTGDIYTTSLVSDIDLVFDSPASLQQQIVLDDLPGQNITIHLDYNNTQPIGSLGAGVRGTGSLTINNGMNLVSGSGRLGYKTGSHGTATVTGPGTSWELTYLNVGHLGHGVLNISNGAEVTSGATSIGSGWTSSTGVATVSGPGTRWTTGDISIGEHDDGMLRIENGAAVYSGYAYIGTDSGARAEIIVTGQGSIWDLGTNGIGIGGYPDWGGGRAILTIEDGGVVICGGMYFPEPENDPSVLTVTGLGSGFHISGNLSTLGPLNITQGGAVNVGGRTQLGSETNNFDGGTLTTGDLYAKSSQLNGAGTINTQGLTSDVDLTFDASRGLIQAVHMRKHAGQDITLNLDGTGEGGFKTLAVGVDGYSSLRIAEGVVVSSYEGTVGSGLDGSGSAMIDGTGSAWHIDTWFRVGGEGGSSTVSVTNGGKLTSNRALIRGRADVDSVDIIGDGSSWINAGAMSIGEYSNAAMNILDGGLVRTAEAFIGWHGNVDYPYTSTASVSGAGSRWEIQGDLVVGDNQGATLVISDGGIVESGAGFISATPNMDTTLTITGVDSAWYVASNLKISHYRTSMTSTINLLDGGLLSVGGNIRVASANGSGNDIGGIVINLDGGILDLNGHGLTLAYVNQLGFHFENGILRDPGTIDLKKPFVQEGGIMEVGDVTVPTQFIGDYTLTGGTIAIELGGVGNPHDLLTATGDIDIAILGTTLDLSAIGPMQAGTYTIIESVNGIIAGAFETIEFHGIAPALYDVQYASNAVTLTLHQDLVPEPGTVGMLLLGIFAGCAGGRGRAASSHTRASKPACQAGAATTHGVPMNADCPGRFR